MVTVDLCVHACVCVPFPFPFQPPILVLVRFLLIGCLALEGAGCVGELFEGTFGELFDCEGEELFATGELFENDVAAAKVKQKIII